VKNSNVHAAEVLSPRAILFLGIVALHAVLGYFLSHGLMQATVQLLKPTMEGVIVPDDRPPPKPPERVIEEPKLQPTMPFEVPVPDDVELVEPAETAFVGATAETQDPVAGVSQPITPVEAPLRLVGRNVFPNADSYYPAADRRMEVEGTALVRACVDDNAKLDGAPVIETSSGSKSLDNAALRVARDARYARSMRGEAPVPNCHRFRVTFSLH
jgi:protein TonB